MDIVLYPDPRLRAKNSAVENFDDSLKSTVREMFRLMYATSGVGLAAPQVGINIQLLIFNPSGNAESKDEEIVLCNPRIVSKSKDKESAEEGCLSFPHIFGNVLRHTSVKIEAQDLNGNKFEVEFEDWTARIFQHEFDHIDGILFVDRMTPASKALVKGDLLEMREQFNADANS
ncbi:MAG: peptide deformylase [Planctomycetota bacterium]|jgi:peptide deformylase|nr:peptide deformylase [Planctomycetota bacterium]